MEYEVFYGCNVAGSIVVVLILLYHLLAAKPIKSISTIVDERDVLTGKSTKKSQ
jgi:hypothetical protein